jgi:hypothetical protein
MKRWQRFATTNLCGKFGSAQALFIVTELRRQFPDLKFKVGAKEFNTTLGGYLTYILAYMETKHPNPDGKRVRDFLESKEWSDKLKAWEKRVQETYQKKHQDKSLTPTVTA